MGSSGGNFCFVDITETVQRAIDVVCSRGEEQELVGEGKEERGKDQKEDEEAAELLRYREHLLTTGAGSDVAIIVAAVSATSDSSEHSQQEQRLVYKDLVQQLDYTTTTILPQFVHFKAHQDILAEHSAVFQKMFFTRDSIIYRHRSDHPRRRGNDGGGGGGAGAATPEYTYCGWQSCSLRVTDDIDEWTTTSTEDEDEFYDGDGGGKAAAYSNNNSGGSLYYKYSPSSSDSTSNSGGSGSIGTNSSDETGILQHKNEDAAGGSGGMKDKSIKNSNNCTNKIESTGGTLMNNINHSMGRDNTEQGEEEDEKHQESPQPIMSTRIVLIRDFAPDIVEEMLRFVYTDKTKFDFAAKFGHDADGDGGQPSSSSSSSFQSADVDFVVEMFKIAHKFQIDKLKDKIRQVMTTTKLLNKQTFVRFFQLVHHDDDDGDGDDEQPVTTTTTTTLIDIPLKRALVNYCVRLGVEETRRLIMDDNLVPLSIKHQMYKDLTAFYPVD